MELTSSLETERHMAKELASKLSNMGVELEESKQNVSNFNLDNSLLSVKSLKGFFGNQGAAYGNRIYLNELVAKFMIRTQDFLDTWFSRVKSRSESIPFFQICKKTLWVYW